MNTPHPIPATLPDHRWFHGTYRHFTHFAETHSLRQDMNAHLGAHFADTPAPANEALRTHDQHFHRPHRGAAIITAHLHGTAAQVSSEHQIAAMALHVAGPDWWAFPTSAPPADLDTYLPKLNTQRADTRTLNYTRVHQLLTEQDWEALHRLNPHWALHVLAAQQALLPPRVYREAIVTLAGHLRTHLLSSGVQVLLYPNDIEGGLSAVALTPTAIRDPHNPTRPWHQPWGAPNPTLESLASL